jgi:hypothetical protein
MPLGEIRRLAALADDDDPGLALDLEIASTTSPGAGAS